MNFYAPPDKKAALRRPVEPELLAAVAVMDEAVEAVAAAPVVDGHLQGVDGQVGAQRAGGLPPDDRAGEHVDDERHVHPARGVFT
jgi:hypothetical protein